jgi:hypothetical protein
MEESISKEEEVKNEPTAMDDLFVGACGVGAFACCCIGAAPPPNR